MGFRFRRSKRLAPGVRLNVGKASGSITVGKRGAKITTGTRGMRAAAGIPGTGLYYVKESRFGRGGNAATHRQIVSPETNADVYRAYAHMLQAESETCRFVAQQVQALGDAMKSGDAHRALGFMNEVVRATQTEKATLDTTPVPEASCELHGQLQEGVATKLEGLLIMRAVLELWVRSGQFHADMYELGDSKVAVGSNAATSALNAIADLARRMRERITG